MQVPKNANKNWGKHALISDCFAIFLVDKRWISFTLVRNQSQENGNFALIFAQKQYSLALIRWLKFLIFHYGMTFLFYAKEALTMIS